MEWRTGWDGMENGMEWRIGWNGIGWNGIGDRVGWNRILFHSQLAQRLQRV